MNLILAVDVHYEKTHAVVAGVAFEDWMDESAQSSFISRIEQVQAYIPGQFYKRELPCILKLLEEHNLFPSHIVIDGFVYLDGHSLPGLGKHLYDALEGKVKVIGVAKRSFKGITEEFAVYRGSSKTPLYVTSVGEEFIIAKKQVASMHGAHRIPTMLKKVDQLCRQQASK